MAFYRFVIYYRRKPEAIDAPSPLKIKTPMDAIIIVRRSQGYLSLHDGLRRLQNIEQRSNDETLLAQPGAQRIPDPMSSGDFTRRFDCGCSLEAIDPICAIFPAHCLGRKLSRRIQNTLILALVYYRRIANCGC